MKKWEELTIADDYVFQSIMQNKDICKQFLEKLLNIKIKSINYIESEKQVKLNLKNKSARFDLYVETDKGVIIDIEMQTENRNDDFLPKRIRYYQGILDLNALKKGKHYNTLKETYIIFICSFDPFKAGRRIYSFHSRCDEDKNILLNDQSHKIFLNAKGKLGKIDPEIQNFLDYVAGKPPKGDLSKKIETEFKKFADDRERRVEYMSMWARMMDEREEGKIEGKREGKIEGKREGKREGKIEGKREGKREGVYNSLKNLMKKMKVNANEAMDLIGVPAGEREFYKLKLQNPRAKSHDLRI